jgi:hypothetical protein
MKTTKNLAKYLIDAIKTVDNQTLSCGTNLSFYNDVAKELAKKDPYAMWKLKHILDTATVLVKLKS